MDLYAENILDHYRNPQNKGPLRHPTVTHRETNVSCGDELTLQFSEKNGIIEEIGWSGEGCAISQAAMSMLAEDLIGKSIRDIGDMKPQHIYDLLGVPISPRRVKCALLCLHALLNAVRHLEGKKPQTWTETIAE